MSKPYMEEYRRTLKAKLKHEGAEGEFPPDKADRLTKGYVAGHQPPAQNPKPAPESK